MAAQAAAVTASMPSDRAVMDLAFVNIAIPFLGSGLAMLETSRAGCGQSFVKMFFTGACKNPRYFFPRERKTSKLFPRKLGRFCDLPIDYGRKSELTVNT
jgi:hypothetical protein